ncbi:MAG: methylated-DNA--[protein]-cysteine S-methyltransferase [Chloroflexi bacterium]|jgi:methylated-DNA-[protein]-cysteine S-methyltransferase|nr:methylated-DNA--[protein]-cysteine S-methyltransferase [Chloroflexota bacterium]
MMKERAENICMAYIENDNIGSIMILATGKGVSRCTFTSLGIFEQQLLEQGDGVEGQAATILADALNQVNAYLQGELKQFDLPIDWAEISPFYRSVYEAAMRIPFGNVCSYGELATVVGKPGAARAVGQALGANPIALIVPCHRIIGYDGHLHGFSAPNGLQTKTWLLRLEGHHIADNRLL